MYNILQENIINGKLKPGTRLVIRRIAEELGVSQIPVREAIRSLEAQGLVVVIPHSGAHVSELNIDEVKEIMELRSVLEGYATRSIMPVKGDTIEQLQKCMEEMRACINAGNLSEFGVINRKFHAIIYEQTPNKRLCKLINEILHESERTRAVFNLSVKRSEEAYKEHEDILNALIDGKEDRVESLVRKHRQRVGQIIIDCIKVEKK